MQHMNIVLIGYRGTGKSAVSRHLAEKTGAQTVSLDDEIVREAGMSIPELVARSGWDAFRDLEEKITRRFAAKDNLIIDCGGGVILRDANTSVLKANGRLIWLKASPAVIEHRISDSTQRPALVEGMTFLEEIEQVLAARTPLYDAAAEFSVNTDDLSPEEIAANILSRM
jgi:shikimate kinase